MKNWTISQKLIGLMLIVGVGSIAVTGWMSVSSATTALLAQQTQALDAIRASRQNLIETYFKDIREQIFNFARDDMIIDATQEFSTAFKSIAEQMGQSTESGSELYVAVQTYYEDEFLPRLEAAGHPAQSTAHYIPESPPARLLQAIYIAENPYPVGEKLELNDVPFRGDYNAVHGKYHSRIRNLLESFGYYDIFLFDLEGNLVYSVFKETDYATNLLSGPYQDTNLADVYHKARAGDASDAIFIEDFRPYDPSYGAPASFIAAPVFRDDQKVGVAAFQMPVDRVNAIMGETAGLGETGASYLIGADHLMRSDARFSGQSTILRQQVDTRAANLALEGRSGTMRQSDYRGVDALTSYGSLRIDDLDWAMLTEIAMGEITEPADRLRNRIAAFGVGLSVLVIALSYYFLRRTVIEPVRKLVEGAHRIEQGEYTALVDVGSSDELGKLGHAFNAMGSAIANDIQKRKQTEDALRQAKDAFEQADSNLREAIESISEGFVAYDSDDRLIMCNEQYRKIFPLVVDKLVTGTTFEEVLDATIERGTFPDDVDKETWKQQRLAEHRSPSGEAFVRHLKNGRWIMSRERLTDRGGIVGIRTDVTELKRAEEELARQSNIITTTLETIDEGIVMVDKNMKAVAHNQRFVDMFELPENLFETDPDYHAIIEYWFEKTNLDQKLRAKAVANTYRREPFQFEQPLPDGRVIEAHHLPRDDGGFVRAFTDITERKRAEELLRESEIRYRFVSERPGQMMYDCDLQTGEFKWSGDVEGVTGHSLSDFPVMDYMAWQDRVHPEDREDALVAFETAIEQRTTCYTEYRFLRKDGVYFYAEDNGFFSFDDEGKPYRMLGLIKDVTERKQAEEAVRESERLLTTVMDNIPAVVFLRDRNGRFRLVNRMYVQIYGASEDSIRGKTLHEVLPQDQADEYAAQDREVIQQKEAIESELTINRNGSAQIFAAVRFPVMDTAGEVFAIGGVELDITERKRAEEELLRAQEAAEAANRAKSEFLSNMSHELRTPLNGVLGYAQILQRDKGVSEQHRESLDAIESCGQHLLTLINDVLELSKIEAGRLEIDQGPADLHRLLQGVQDVVRQRADSKGLEFSLDVSPEVPRGIITDATKLKQVLVNLIGNSVKFTERGYVTLRVAESKDKRLVFSVEDTGIGMTPQELQDIFDPFKQAEGGKTSGGTGLGLAISQRIVVALGGALDVKSEKGEGSCFSFSLPLSEVDDIDVASFREESLTDKRQAVLAPGQDITVLIVDDHDTNRDILKHLLTAAGFETVEAENGKEAIDKLRKHQITLALMDVRMPVMNGIDATQEIRRDPKLKDTVIIAVTASVFPEFKDRAMEVGFDDFIAKPYRAAEVFAKIEQHLKVKFVDEAQEDLSAENTAEVAALAPELAKDVATRLRNAVELGNLSELNALATELMERNDNASTYGQKISRLTKSFDFAGVIALADSLEQPATEDAV